MRMASGVVPLLHHFWRWWREAALKHLLELALLLQAHLFYSRPPPNSYGYDGDGVGGWAGNRC
jgi:hypothetical protein